MRQPGSLRSVAKAWELRPASGLVRLATYEPSQVDSAGKLRDQRLLAVCSRSLPAESTGMARSSVWLLQSQKAFCQTLLNIGEPVSQSGNLPVLFTDSGILSLAT